MEAKLANSVLISLFLSEDSSQSDHCLIKEVSTSLFLFNPLHSVVDNLPVDLFVLTWSLINWVTVVHLVVVVEHVFVILGAIRHASHDWKELSLLGNIQALDGSEGLVLAENVLLLSKHFKQ